MANETRHPGTTHLLNLFEYEHLPEHLRRVSRDCAELADDMAAELNDGPELTAGLRKLLEAKDCFVRQAVIDAREALVEKELCPDCGQKAGHP